EHRMSDQPREIRRMSIELDPITSGYQLSKINENFQKIENDLNNTVVHRSGDVPQETMMQRNLDMNGYSILNATIDLPDGIEEIMEQMREYMERAELAAD